MEGFCCDESDVAFRNHLSTSNPFSCDKHSFFCTDTDVFCCGIYCVDNQCQAAEKLQFHCRVVRVRLLRLIV